MTTFVKSYGIDEAAQEFLEQIREVNTGLQTELIERAYRFSWSAHRDQVRKSGEPFLSHPVAVSLILAEQQLDAITICAGLLHDVLEDTTFSKEKLSQEFGQEIALLVDGVTKIQKLEMRTREERKAETYRKMLLSMARDIRVIIIKFADRLHNLRTLRYLEPEKVRMIAQETLDIYAPLAHRLGMAKIKWELEDLAFKHLHPEEHRNIVAKVVGSRHERERLIESFSGPIRRRLHEEGVTATVIGRPKHFFSIYRKMSLYNKPFDEIYDLLAIRIITRSIRDCYAALGIVHSLWKPIQDRFKDYISTPKSNGYQSIHTTVVGEKGNIVEIQIRTWEMNQIAEDGIAAHWLYKDGRESVSSDDRALVWLKNLIEWQKDLTDSTEFFEFFKIDLFDAEIFVFTPKGDLVSLPKGARVLDFAFAVHTDLGLHCIGAKVDGKIEPISSMLRSGSTVEVLHSASKRPSLDWLQHIKTPKARSAIRRWLRGSERRESIELGKNILRTNYNKLHLSTPFSDHIAGLLEHLGISGLDRLFELVGSGELPIGRVMQYFHSKKSSKKPTSNVVSRFVKTFSKAPDVRVGDTDKVMVRFAKCCNPIPGDDITGFVTRGRGIAVHRADCSNVKIFAEHEERRIEVSWDESDDRRYVAFLDVLAQDRPGLLHDITGIFVNFGADIYEATVHTTNGKVHDVFKVGIRNRNQLKQIFDRLNKVKGVEKVSRTQDHIFSYGSSSENE